MFEQLIKEYEDECKEYESATNKIDQEHYKANAESIMTALNIMFIGETSRYLRDNEISK